MACVYVHRRADDGRIFYVGKGSRNDRASFFSKRNPYWKAVAAKHGVVVEIVAYFETDMLACEFERELIAWYGRSKLTNLTDGGEGSVGVVMSEAAKKKLSVHAQKPRSDAWVQSIRKARAGGGNGGVVKTGDKLPASWVANLAAAKLGAKNPMFGITGALHRNSRKVRDAATGLTYDSVSIAATARGYKMKTLYNWLSGHSRNPTTLEFA